MAEQTQTLTLGGPRSGRVALRLVVVSGPDLGATLALGGPCVLGKDEGCALMLGDPAVSRRHLSLEPGPEGVRARDLGSKNGSYLDGVRFREVILQPGTVITIGATQLRVQAVTEPTSLLPSSAERFGLLIGTSLVMREVFAVLERAAPSEAAILIEGETGTGKELCAQSIHQASGRADGPFVVADLAGTQLSLLESELFGHRRGAFTGAERDRAGTFVDASGGTLFLDELGELPKEAQPRLLRALAQGEVKPVGGDRYRAIDVRVVSATNRSLPLEVIEGRFREDLFHRLAVIRVRLPPLRERKEDLPLLVRTLLGPREVTLSPEAEALLCEHEWPGNVRELRNVLERALSLLGPGEGTITEVHLGIGSPVPGRTRSVVSFREAKERLIADWERDYLEDLLRRAGGNVALAARLSGIDRPYLYKLMKKHRLGDPPR